jgi:hypothetical protein
MPTYDTVTITDCGCCQGCISCLGDPNNPDPFHYPKYPPYLTAYITGPCRGSQEIGMGAGLAGVFVWQPPSLNIQAWTQFWCEPDANFQTPFPAGYHLIYRIYQNSTTWNFGHEVSFKFYLPFDEPHSCIPLPSFTFNNSHIVDMYESFPGMAQIICPGWELGLSITVALPPEAP